MKRAIIFALVPLLSSPASAWVDDVCGLRTALVRELVGWRDGLKGSNLPEEEQRQFAEEGMAEMIAAYDLQRDMARDYLRRNGVCPPKPEPWQSQVRR